MEQRGRHKAWGGGGGSSTAVKRGANFRGGKRRGTGGGGVGTKWSAPLERATTLIRIFFPSPSGFEVGVGLMWV